MSTQCPTGSRSGRIDSSAGPKVKGQRSKAVESATWEAARLSHRAGGGAPSGWASIWEYRAAQSHQARAEEPQEPSWGTAKGGHTRFGCQGGHTLLGQRRAVRAHFDHAGMPRAQTPASAGNGNARPAAPPTPARRAPARRTSHRSPEGRLCPPDAAVHLGMQGSKDSEVVKVARVAR